jgi:dipeptide transport system substrate-binding protein
MKLIRSLAIPAVLAASVWSGAAHAKTLVYCSEASPETFNPMLGVSDSTMDASAKPIFNRLVEFKPGTTEVVPALAESWDVSADGKTYTFHLRKGVKFQSNEDFTPTRDFNADDVLYTFNRQRDAKNPYHALGGGKYEYFDALGLGPLIGSIDKVDDYTVRFGLTSANVTFLSGIALDYLSILSLEQTEKYVKDGHPEKIDQTPVGTGPFDLVAYQIDSVVRYKANKDYWHGAPKIDDLVFAITPDASVRTAKLKDGECDVSTQPLAADVSGLKSSPDITLLSQQGQNIGVLGFNVEHPALMDKRVRLALAKAVNRESIVKAVYQGAGNLARGVIPPVELGAAKDADPNTYDPAAAKALLKEAGHESDLSIKLWAMPVSRPYNPNARRMAELIQADWAAVGVKSEIVTAEWTDYLKRTAAGEHDAYLLGGSTDNGDPDNIMSYMLSCDGVKGGSNRSRWCSQDFEKLLDAGRVEQNLDARAKIYQQAQAILDADMPMVPIANSVVYMPIRKRVQNYILDAFGRQNFADVDVTE